MIGRVVQLWRHPVKSLAGESLAAVEVDRRGVVGDRLWALVDGNGRFGSGKSTRRFVHMAGLMRHRSWYDGQVPVVALADGRVVRGDAPDADALLSDVAGVPVTLRQEGLVSHFDDAPLHLVTTASLAELSAGLGAALDVRRVRANVVVDTGAAHGWVEDSWVGREVQVGGVRLAVTDRMPRCVMTTQEQHGLAADPSVLRALGREHDAMLGVMATPLQPGRVAVGDQVTLA